MIIKKNLQLLVAELDNDDKAEILNHLRRLSPSDRYMRFFVALSDYALEKYVTETVNLSTSKGFGIFANDRKTLIAFAHVANEEITDIGKCAELGISVDSEFRGQGLARRLMDRTLVHCKAHDIGTLYMSCLRENAAMQHLAKSSGLNVILSHDEAIAKLKLADWPMDKMSSVSHDIAYQQIAIVDKCYRRNADLVNALLKGL